MLGTYPLRSRVVQELQEVIDAQVESLSAQIAQLEEGHAKFSAGKALQDRGIPELALKELDLARRAVPSSPLIARTIEACADAVQKTREQQAQQQARLALATQAADRSDWETVLAITKELEDGAADNALIVRLRDNAVRGLEADRARQNRTSSTRRPAAESAPLPRAAARVPAADASSSDATTLGPGAGAEPAPPPEATPTALSARATELREQATRHLHAGDFTNAERVANEAMTLNTADTESRHLLERVRAAIALRARQEENGRRITDLLKRADALADLKRFDKALALCDEALQIEPTHEGAVATRDRLADEQAAHDAEREREAARERRLRAAAPALQQARRAFEGGDLERARWSAENALALAPESEEAHALLAQIAAATPEPSPDDTVKLSDPQSDETAELAPLQETVQDRVRNQASSWIRQWRSSDAKTKG
jgi:hypothetical protein